MEGQLSIPSKTMALENVRRLMHPLDLLLFKGTDPVSSTICLVERLETQCGLFSHCGILVNSELMPFLPQLKPGRLYVWESTFSYHLPGRADDTPNVETGTGDWGVQIRDLEEVLSAYLAGGRSRVAWAPLRHSPWLALDKEAEEEVRRRRSRIIAQVQELHARYGGCFYDFNPFNLLAAACPCWRRPRAVMHELMVEGRKLLSSQGAIRPSFFCSALTAEIYRRLGIIDTGLDPQDVLPVDFLGADKDGMSQVVGALNYLAINSLRGLDELIAFNPEPRRGPQLSIL